MSMLMYLFVALAGGLNGTLFFSQKLGSGPFTGISIAAGIVVSILLDHSGLVLVARF